MAALFIVDLTVTEPDGYAEYGKGVAATIEQYGGRYLVRGGRHEVVEGDWRPMRLVVIEFPSVEQAKRWYDSPEYAPLKAIRRRTARTNGVLVEGV